MTTVPSSGKVRWDHGGGRDKWKALHLGIIEENRLLAPRKASAMLVMEILDLASASEPLLPKGEW